MITLPQELIQEKIDSIIKALKSMDPANEKPIVIFFGISAGNASKQAAFEKKCNQLSQEIDQLASEKTHIVDTQTIEKINLTISELESKLTKTIQSDEHRQKGIYLDFFIELMVKLHAAMHNNHLKLDKLIFYDTSSLHRYNRYWSKDFQKQFNESELLDKELLQQLNKASIEKFGINYSQIVKALNYSTVEKRKKESKKKQMIGASWEEAHALLKDLIQKVSHMPKRNTLRQELLNLPNWFPHEPNTFQEVWRRGYALLRTAASLFDGQSLDYIKANTNYINSAPIPSMELDVETRYTQLHTGFQSWEKEYTLLVKEPQLERFYQLLKALIEAAKTNVESGKAFQSTFKPLYDWYPTAADLFGKVWEEGYIILINAAESAFGRKHLMHNGVSWNSKLLSKIEDNRPLSEKNRSLRQEALISYFEQWENTHEKTLHQFSRPPQSVEKSLRVVERSVIEQFMEREEIVSGLEQAADIAFQTFGETFVEKYQSIIMRNTKPLQETGVKVELQYWKDWYKTDSAKASVDKVKDHYYKNKIFREKLHDQAIERIIGLIGKNSKQLIENIDFARLSHHEMRAYHLEEVAKVESLKEEYPDSSIIVTYPSWNPPPLADFYLSKQRNLMWNLSDPNSKHVGTHRMLYFGYDPNPQKKPSKKSINSSIPSQQAPLAQTATSFQPTDNTIVLTESHRFFKAELTETRQFFEQKFRELAEQQENTQRVLQVMLEAINKPLNTSLQESNLSLSSGPSDPVDQQSHYKKTPPPMFALNNQHTPTNFNSYANANPEAIDSLKPNSTRNLVKRPHLSNTTTPTKDSFIPWSPKRRKGEHSSTDGSSSGSELEFPYSSVKRLT